MFSVLAAILVKALVPSLTLLTPLVSWGLAAGARYISKKAKNEAVDTALTRITHTVGTTVANLNQTLVKEMKAKTADGKLTKKDAKDLKEIAIETVKAQVPFAVKQIAEGGVNSLSTFISAKIEQAVLNQKGFSPIISGIDWADKP